MWILTPLQAGGETHYLLPGKELVVGRKNCDVLLPSDQSISRAHAQLTATHQTLTLTDTSKYGTFVNSERLTAPVSLKSGDEVTFGVFHSKFSVCHQQPVVCSSCLDNEGKASLSEALQALGGNLVNSWTHDCTHLVMPSVKVTIKTISALLCCRPIVKPEFFSELNEAVQQKLPPPKAESFTPDIDEPSLNKEDVNLGVMPARQQLFTGKTFVFLSAKQLKRLSAAVKLGGGSSRLLEEGSLLTNLLESPQSCVVDVTTGNSQTLLPPSTTQWANSVRSIVQRKGLRVITESEIGLAAIYASCDKYCNPSNLTPDSGSAPKVKPRIPGASLSQSVAVDETLLPAASQNITAYAANTETSQRVEVTGVNAVGETPEKKQNQNSDRLRGAQKTTTQYVVDDTMSSSFNITENSQRKKPDSRLTDAGPAEVRPQPSKPKSNGGTKTSFFRQSPHKPKTSAQASPQKQSTLISFFQPVGRKRPLEDEFSDVMSEPKRPVLEPSVAVNKPNSTKETSSPSIRSVSETPPESDADLFTGRREEPRNRKRKGMEEEIQMEEIQMEEIQMEELESIMSEDMDGFGQQLSDQQTHKSAKQKPASAAVESLNKRQRLQREEEADGRSREEKLLTGLEKKSGLHNNQRSEQQVDVKTEPLHPTDDVTAHKESRSGKQTASTSRNMKPGQDASFIQDLELIAADIFQPKDDTKTPLKPVRIKQEDLELIAADIFQPKDDTKTPLKPVRIKQEVQESKMDESLPRNQVLVEFRSLTVSTPPTSKHKQTQANDGAKNFKCFRKNRVRGSDRFQNIIGGSDLLVHSRGKNTDLDEWMKDAAEEERQSRREEAAGDDLFRYNPTKLAKRR